MAQAALLPLGIPALWAPLRRAPLRRVLEIGTVTISLFPARLCFLDQPFPDLASESFLGHSLVLLIC